jgi:hypothetical protein
MTTLEHLAAVAKTLSDEVHDLMATRISAVANVSDEDRMIAVETVIADLLARVLVCSEGRTGRLDHILAVAHSFVSTYREDDPGPVH